MITFITAGRNDDYGQGFLERFYTSVSKNLESLEKLEVEYEYLIVEWAPINSYLIHTGKFADLFKNNNKLIDVIVRSDVNLNEQLNINSFHEYFAKNVGIRMSKYSNLVLLNADIVIPFNTMKNIVETIKSGLDKSKYYRPRWRVQVDNNCKELRKGAVNSAALPEHEAYMKITGDFPGDLFFIDRDTLINKGKGYDETNFLHRTISQVHMDSEIMYNLWKNGCTLEYSDDPYWHIEHARSNRNNMQYKNVNGYPNKPNWGFIDYKRKKRSDNLIEISWL